MTNASSIECCESRISDFLAGELSDAATHQLEEHLCGCDRCADKLNQLTAAGTFWEDTTSFLSTASSLSTSNPLDQPFDPLHQPSGVEQTLPESSHAATSRNQLGFLDATDDPHMLGRFAGYEICGLVGCGGMGIVLKGRDVSLDRIIAIKVLNPSYAGQSAARQRFAREAQAAAAVVHDNVISIYGVDEWNELPYLAMPYIKGESLQQRIDRAAPLDWQELLQISIQIAHGLAAAHDQGLIHRDIKPANILLLESVSRVIITDFGLARTVDDASLTRSGVLAGTPQYMSPEQVKSEHLDGRTDLFSLGAVMYAMACGRPPFRSETPYGVMRKITDTPHRSLSVVRNDTPMWLESIIQRLLQKDADQRFQSALDLATHLEECLAHVRHPTTTALPMLNAASQESPEPVNAAPMWRRSWLLAVGALLAVLICSLPFINNLMRPTGSQSIVSPAQQATGTEATAEYLPDFQAGHFDWQYDDSRLSELESELESLRLELAPTAQSTEPIPTNVKATQ